MFFNKKKRPVISFSHVGVSHIKNGINNQDYILCKEKLKLVFDGCGSRSNSEVGPRVFAQLFMKESEKLVKEGESINEENFERVVDIVFKRMLLISKDPSFLFENYCFTILACLETETEYIVMSCGDGFIILDDGGSIAFQELDDGLYPRFYIYNYIEDKSRLMKYQEGVSFTIYHFDKTIYRNVGIASDGLRFYSGLSQTNKKRFARSLQAGNSRQIERIIKRYKFYDDITICF